MHAVRTLLAPSFRLPGLALALLSVIVFSCSEERPRQGSPGEPAPNPTPVTAEDGRREVYELWKASEQIAPLMPLPGPSTVGEAQRETIIGSLNARSFLQFEDRHRRNFREFRDGVVACAALKDVACTVTNMGRFFALLADWRVDSNSAARFGDARFIERVEAYETFAKGFSLVSARANRPSSSRPDPNPCAGSYAELYYLAERLGGTQEGLTTGDLKNDAKFTTTHATRAGIMGVDTSKCVEIARRRVLDELKSDLAEIAADYGKGDWDRRNKDGLSKIIWSGNQLRLQASEFRGTSYDELADVVEKVHELFH